MEQQGSTDAMSISSDGDKGQLLLKGQLIGQLLCGKLLEQQEGYPNDIGNYVTYEALFLAYKAFGSSLRSVSILTDLKKAKEGSKWRMAMVEELEDLCKNKTWVLPPCNRK